MRRILRRNEVGAAAVEFALIVPMLLLLVFGIAEFGRAYNIQVSLSAAAREGARVMAIEDDAVAARAATLAAAPSLQATNTNVEVTPLSCAPGSNATVNATYSFDFVTGLFGAGIELNGRGVMRCNG
jgi:Flp pilus assembly protein TadG